MPPAAAYPTVGSVDAPLLAAVLLLAGAAVGAVHGVALVRLAARARQAGREGLAIPTRLR